MQQSGTTTTTTTTSGGGETVLSPQNVAIAAGTHENTISWDSVEGADSYNVYWRTSAGVTTSDSKIEDADSPYVHTGLSNDEEYFYAVTAVEDGVESAVSTETSASPSYANTSVDEPVCSGGPPANGFFGSAASMDSDYLLVGNSGVETSTGEAYVFKRNGSSFECKATLTASDRTTNDFFGISVAISGDYAVVGQSADEDGDNGGNAYIFKRSGESWSQTAKITGSDTLDDDSFGDNHGVGISGDYAIVGASGNDALNINGGAAYIFKRTGESWSQETKLVPTDAHAGQLFGFSVAIDGNYAIVGARDGLAATGNAYIYELSNGTWNQTKILTPSDGGADDRFGWSVAISGNYAIVGAESKDGGIGGAYMFERNGGSWDEAAIIRASDAQAGDVFGISAAINGDIAIVGAAWEDGGAGDPLANAGAAYLFQRGTSGWPSTETVKLTPPAPEAGANFGQALAIDSGFIAISAINETTGGAVHIY